MNTLRVAVLALLALAAPPVASAQTQDEVRVIFNQYVKSQNDRNLAEVGQVLHDSRDFLWVTPRGAPVWGRDAALAQMTELFKGVWQIEPDMSALRITPAGDSAARLTVPVKYTIGASGQAEPYLLNQFYVKTPVGWRISTVLPVPVAPR